MHLEVLGALESEALELLARPEAAVRQCAARAADRAEQWIAARPPSPPPAPHRRHVR